MEGLERTLSALRDVRGVEGSFYASRDGRIVGRDLPRIFDGDPLDGVASRVGRILEAMHDLEGQHEGALVRYPNHALLIRPTEDGVLCVLATSDVNVPSLKRGASLVARRLPNLPQLPSLREARTTPPAASTARVGPPGETTAKPASLPPPPPPARTSAPVAMPPKAAVHASVPGAPAQPAVRWRGASKSG